MGALAFENLIRYIESGDIAATVHKVFPLSEIAAAQEAFLKKKTCREDCSYSSKSNFLISCSFLICKYFMQQSF